MIQFAFGIVVPFVVDGRQCQNQHQAFIVLVDVLGLAEAFQLAVQHTVVPVIDREPESGGAMDQFGYLSHQSAADHIQIFSGGFGYIVFCDIWVLENLLGQMPERCV